jgi:hypothetical protein
MPSQYERGKIAGENILQHELWAVEHDWKMDRLRLIAERDDARAETNAWRQRAENALQKLQERVPA